MYWFITLIQIRPELQWDAAFKKPSFPFLFAFLLSSFLFSFFISTFPLSSHHHILPCPPNLICFLLLFLPACFFFFLLLCCLSVRSLYDSEWEMGVSVLVLVSVKSYQLAAALEKRNRSKTPVVFSTTAPHPRLCLTTRHTQRWKISFKSTFIS